MPKTAEPDLSALFDNFGAEGGLDRFLRRVAQVCVDWFGAAAVSLFLRLDGTGEFLLSAQAGPEASIPSNTILRSGEGLAGQAIENGTPRWFEDARGGAMIIPLQTPEAGCIGVLNVARPTAFTERDLVQAGNLARYVALAVNNSRLYSQLNQAVGQARALGAKLDAIIACLGVGVLVVSEFDEVTGWNPEAKRLFGDSLFAGRLVEHVLEKCPRVLSIAVQQALQEAKNERRASRRAFDSTFDQAWSVIASPLPAGGVTLAIQDVSEHERAQREIGRLNRLAEIGQMTAAIAHEIRNPLTGIRSAAQMVRSSDSETAEFGRIIEEEALKLNGLCDQFLDFARPLQLSLREVDLVEVARLVVERHQPDARQADVLLELNAEPACQLADPLRLEQVLRNLILNALQASHPGGKVQVRIAPGLLSVRDNGRGIDGIALGKLFTPFFTTKPHGTGLGLPTVRKIVDAHGWHIRVESSPGRGATFLVEMNLEKHA